METACIECDAVLHSSLTSDLIEGSTAGSVPFFVVRQAVAASMDMGVGHAGLVKLCRFLDIKPLTHTSFTKRVHAICDANKIVVTRMFTKLPTQSVACTLTSTHRSRLTAPSI